MGDIVRFTRHARASAGSDIAGHIAAKASKVICSQPFSPASRTMSGQRRAGMKPRARQVLTVESGKPSPLDTAPVPPRSSMAECTVSGKLGSVIGRMPEDIVRNLRTSQEFAICETTFSVVYGGITAMIDPPQVIGRRLKALREALDCPTQTEFAERIGVEKQTYNPWENGKRPLTFEGACKIRKAFQIPLDYLFFGDADELKFKIIKKLQDAA